MTITTIDVALESRRYSIYVASSFSALEENLKKYLSNKSCCIITDENVAKIHLPNALTILKEFHPEVLIIPAGEQQKNLHTIELITQFLIEKQLDRASLLIALGGGVVGDMTGFAAAIYRRGINYLQIPTTLLAQVDSAIGGKTGVNHALGKNMLGCFHQPKAVFSVIETLKTLPIREFNAGIAEVIKYALLADNDFFMWLQENCEDIIARNEKCLTYLIARCSKIKAEIVAIDEFETTGERALLNLGHTFGHAIETHTHYQTWLHGEAVAVGLLMAARMSVLQNLLSLSDYIAIENLVLAFSLPSKAPDDLTCDNFLALMQRDKKVSQKQLSLVLLKQIGQAILTKDFSIKALEKTIAEFCTPSI